MERTAEKIPPPLEEPDEDEERTEDLGAEAGPSDKGPETFAGKGTFKGLRLCLDPFPGKGLTVSVVAAE